MTMRNEPGPPSRDEVLQAARAISVESETLAGAAGGRAAAEAMLLACESHWIPFEGSSVHLGLWRAASPARATIVFQPGSGSHALNYAIMAGLFARAGFNVVGIDRPGHGLSEGPRGHCTIETALAVGDAALAWARTQLGGPVVLMGSSMGGMLTVFGLLSGSRADLAVAHNFLYPAKLASMRLRAWWIRRHRTRPYPLNELVHGFERLSADPVIGRYMTQRDDPGAAFALSAPSIASLFSFRARGPAHQAPTLVLSGTRDPAIPAWATRVFTRWSGLRHYEYLALRGAGHLLFHDHVAEAVPAITRWLEAQLAARLALTGPELAPGNDAPMARLTTAAQRG